MPMRPSSESLLDTIAALATPLGRSAIALLRVSGPRTREILACIARGLSDREIAETLVLSTHTVHRHVANIRRKLGRRSRTAAVAEAARLGLL